MAEIDDFLKTFRQAEPMRRKTRRTLLIAAACAFVGNIALAALIQHLTGRPFFGFGIIPVFLLIGAFGTPVNLKDATRRIAELDEIRSVGLLVEVLDLLDRPVRTVAAAGLTRLLPRLTPDDAHLLNAAQRARLYRVFPNSLKNLLNRNVSALFEPAPEQTVSLRVAILQALAQVGDERAVPIVERLAAGHAIAGQDRRVREAAQTCLPQLRERVRQLQSPHTLLRAAPAQNDSGILLRAAGQSPAAADAVQLVRPSDANGNTLA